jgi:small-conductance mechanosensitive channel
MNEHALFTSIGFAMLVLLGAALALVIVILRAALRLIPMNRPLRGFTDRAAPVVGLALAIAYLGFVVRMLFREEQQLVSALLALIIVALVALGWGSIRDVVAGVVVKAGQNLRIGDHVRVGDVGGRIISLGYRVVTVETPDGEQAIVPFHALSKGIVQRSQSAGSTHLHVFRLSAAGRVSVAEIKQAASEAALRCHWASVVHPPKFEVDENGMLEMTVYALHPDYALEIEAAVRRATESLTVSPPREAGMPERVRN